MFQCYGENSFTFLFFQAIRQHSLGRTMLLPNLKQFGSGRLFSEELDADTEPDIWLFPNFGRTYGFGEPDALLLMGNLCFWFEVETWIDLGTDPTGLSNSLLQLSRFHFLHLALARSTSLRTKGGRHRAIMGLTISNDRTVKQAVLKVKGHPVLQKIRKRFSDMTAHYVLLTHRMPTGLTGQRFEQAMEAALGISNDSLGFVFHNWAASTGTPVSQLPELPSKDRCWYAYWSGHIDHQFRKLGLPDPLVAGGYLGIRK
jgi:hypothetical protein